MKGVYYYTKKIYQFSQSRPIYKILKGKIITTTLKPFTFIFFLVRYGPMRAKIMKKSMNRLDNVAKGLILCHSGDNRVPKGKNYERIFVYHATGDKTFTGPGGKISTDWFEHFFVTGEKDLYKLKHYTLKSELLEKKIVKIGMFRSDSIINGDYDREKILRKYRIRDNGKKIILYAPTWKWGGGTLEECFEIFAQKIPEKYILIIRPHFNDAKKIMSILKWQINHKIKDLYIFPKQYQDIMNFIYISDLLIGDNSSVNYDFAFMKRPMVFVKTDLNDTFIPPNDYNIKLCGPIFDPKIDDIMEKIEESFQNPIFLKRIENLLYKSFYFNDGRAKDRVCSFIVDRLSEMGIVKKEKIMKKLKNRFVYINNYR